MNKRGFFLVFEGGEGSGKSTAAHAIADHLSARGAEVVLTREPGGTGVAEAIRDLLLSDQAVGADPWCEALLFAAARADHVGRLIAPALDRGAVVLCDRFVDSSVAYQGVAGGLGQQAVRRANDSATAGVVPDLVVVLDIDPEVGLGRARGPNHIEARPLDFHRAVRAAFLDFAASDPQRYIVIDATAPPDHVHAVILGELQRRGWGVAR